MGEEDEGTGLSLMENYEGYGWIKVKRYKMDPEKTWEERYQELEKHHIEEMNFLIDKVRELAQKLNEQEALLEKYERFV